MSDFWTWRKPDGKIIRLPATGCFKGQADENNKRYGKFTLTDGSTQLIQSPADQLPAAPLSAVWDFGDKPRIGTVIRYDSGGLASQSVDVLKHLDISNTMLIKIGERPEVYKDSTKKATVKVTGMPNRSDFDVFLKDLDVVLFWETPYYWPAIDMARERGIKTVLDVNYEWLSNEVKRYKPDMLWMTTDWFLDDLKSFGVPVKYIPYPVDRKRFPFKKRFQDKDAVTFLSVLGHSRFAKDDRQGVACLRSAIKLSKSKRARFIIRSIDKVDPIDDPRVTILVGCQSDPAKNYADGDVLVYPRRYAGLSLPINEALSCGLPVLTGDMDPQNKLLPRHWLAKCSIKPYEFFPTRHIDICDVDPADLARIIDHMVENGTEAESVLAGMVADEISWERQLPAIKHMLSHGMGKHERPYFVRPMEAKNTLTIAYLGNFGLDHCTEVHISKSLETLGHNVIRLQEGKYDWKSVVEKSSDADLLLWQRTPGICKTEGAEGLRMIDELRKDGIKTASVHLDLYLGLKRDNDVDLKNPFWATDMVFSADGGNQKEFKKRGVNHTHLAPGCFQHEAYPGKYNPKFAHDIVFVGSYPYPHKEWTFRNRMIGEIKKRYGSRFQTYGSRQGVRNADLNDLYASAKIVIGDSLYSPDYWSDRYTETMGRGGFLIAPIGNGIEKLFDPVKHFVGFDYEKGNLESYDELFATIDYYLEHDAERETIRRAGFDFVRSHHTYMHRCQTILEVLYGPNLDQEKRVMTSKRLMLGSGMAPGNDASWINVDIVGLGNNVVHDLNVYPWPFADGTFAEVRAIDILEHLDNPSEAIREIIRILQPGGKMTIQVPNAKYPERVWIDPEHKRGFCPESLDYWVRGTNLEQSYGHSHHQGKFFISDLEVTPINFNLTFEAKKPCA